MNEAAQPLIDYCAIPAGATQAASRGVFELGIVENDDVYSMLGKHCASKFIVAAPLFSA